MPRALIINADDLGYEPEVTRGIIEAMREGVVSSTTFMVNGPHSAAAAAAAKGLPVGLHLNLARWAKLSAKGEWDEAQAAALDAGGAAKETHAQLERFQKLMGRPPTHVDVHKHLHRHAAVLEGVAKAAAQHRLPVRSIDKAMRGALRKLKAATNDHFIGDAVAGGPAYWSLEQLERSLEQLPKSGVIELMCHPGHAPRLIESGYGAQREVELATFTSPSARAWLERIEVVPVSWEAAFT
ncbi:MAG: ChbG/HpnK family deacetylase [Myxococcaceae bacterium]|nr:ChbG/HpnK family deacetylase [Myxococcaceae bacterium]